MKIAIITENFLKPWYPNDIDNFLPGTQECVILFSEMLKNKAYDVNVFFNGPTIIETTERKNIIYRDFSKFSLDDNYDIIFLIKINPLTDDDRLEKINVIFISVDNKDYSKNKKYIRNFICLTQFHKNLLRLENSIIIPNGIDLESLENNRVEKEKNTILYSSSPDRGLINIFQNMENIRKNFPEMKIYITYGFDIARKFFNDFTKVDDEERKVELFCNHYNIFYLKNLTKNDFEKLYWKCQYWILPLIKEDSELFCLNAVKSQYCGCIPIINKIGPLKETVGNYIEFTDFINGNLQITKSVNKINTYTWNQTFENFWKKIL